MDDPRQVESLNRSFCAAFIDNLACPNGPARAGMLLVRDIPLSYMMHSQMGGEEDEDEDEDGPGSRRQTADSSTSSDDEDSGDADGDKADDGTVVDECCICLLGLAPPETVATLPCDHKLHKACLEPLRCLPAHQQRCPLCRRPIDDSSAAAAAAFDDQASDPGKTRKNVFVHPGSSLSQMAQSAAAGAGVEEDEHATWIAYASLVETSKAFVQQAVRVDPAWPEVQDHVDVASVQQSARAIVRTVFIGSDLLPAFIGRQAAALRNLESILDVVIGLPQQQERHDRQQQRGHHAVQPPQAAGVVELQIFGTSSSIESAVQAVEARVRLLEEEAMQRQLEWEERQRRRQEEYEERQLRREEERRRRQEAWEERQRARERRHQEYMARQAARAAREREGAERMRARSSSARSYPYCGTPPGVPSRYS